MRDFDKVPQDRPFTSREASGRGLTRYRLALLVDRGLVVPIFRGLYVVRTLELTVQRRAAALARVMPENVVATDETAAWLHGVDVMPGRPGGELPRLSFFQTGAHERLRNGSVRSGSRGLAKTDVTRVSGVRTTTPLRTALDLARLRWPSRAIGALDGLLGLGVFTVGDMVRELERFKGYRGVVQARMLVPLADARSESPAESLLRYEWLRADDLPPPVPQLPVVTPYSSRPWRLDLAVEELRYAVEYDGERFHMTPQQVERDNFRRAYLREVEGWTIDVLRKDDVYPASANPVALIRAGVLAACRRLGVPPESWRRPAG